MRNIKLELINSSAVTFGYNQMSIFICCLWHSSLPQELKQTFPSTTDNFYASIEFFKSLRLKKTGECGTVHVNRKGLLSDMKI